MAELRYEITSKSIDNTTYILQYKDPEILGIFRVEVYLGEVYLVCSVEIWNLTIIRSYYTPDQTCEAKWEIEEIRTEEGYVDKGYESKLMRYVLKKFTEPMFFHALSEKSIKFHFQCGANFLQSDIFFNYDEGFMMYNVSREKGIKYSSQLYDGATKGEIEKLWDMNTSKQPQFICPECCFYNECSDVCGQCEIKARVSEREGT